MLKNILKKMGFNSKNLVVANDNTQLQQPQMQKQQQISTASLNDLSPQELEILLIALKECTIKGAQIELFYNLVLKIQNKYMSIK